jgi:serine/threonine-protein kinase
MLPGGSTFAGYTILDRLNQGGMADIYLAQNSTGQKVVLRILLPEHRFHWRSRRRFRWGCEVLGQLHHPNIVQFFGYNTFAGRRYAVLEYVDGGNLKEHILRANPALRTHQVKLLAGMAAGLAHIHERGFLHLDFKPENVVLTRQYDPKLVDLDLSVRRPPYPKRHAILSGTLAYLAPEQIARQPVDERADIFAFGLTAYEMLAGKKPVTGNSRAELLQKYAEFDAHLKPLRAQVPDVPVPIEQMILKCLEKDVNRRYPSMQLALRDLQQ